jgi:hydroxyacyl-ACP dehydratase HTD2-like protein with hotdog domain
VRFLPTSEGWAAPACAHGSAVLTAIDTCIWSSPSIAPLVSVSPQQSHVGFTASIAVRHARPAPLEQTLLIECAVVRAVPSSSDPTKMKLTVEAKLTSADRHTEYSSGTALIISVQQPTVPPGGPGEALAARVSGNPPPPPSRCGVGTTLQAAVSSSLQPTRPQTVFTTDDGTTVDFGPFLDKVDRVTTDVATAAPLTMLISIFDRPAADLQLVEAGLVPRGWVYSIGGGIYLQSRDPESSLKPDGLPGLSSVGDAPPVDAPSGEAAPPQTLAAACAALGLTRTLFGGVKLRFVSDIHLGDRLRAEDSTEKVRITRSAASGLMAITTVVRRIYAGEHLALEQWQTDVVRGAPSLPEVQKSGSDDNDRSAAREAPPKPKPKPKPPTDTSWRVAFKPSEVALFSYSALTFNRHRIHYDAHWAEQVEGYPGLVVHGPYVLQLCIDFIRDHTGMVMTELEMRAMQPLFVNQEITVRCVCLRSS